MPRLANSKKPGEKQILLALTDFDSAIAAFWHIEDAIWMARRGSLDPCTAQQPRCYHGDMEGVHRHARPQTLGHPRQMDVKN